MSAACALTDIANIAAAHRTLRIDHSYPHIEHGVIIAR
jgi:hypothetical protein